MPSFTLTDAAHNIWVDSFALHAHDIGPATVDWSVTKRTLRGGRRDLAFRGRGAMVALP